VESVRFSPVGERDWSVVAWLWQLFRHDLAPTVHGLPYADGRYQAAPLASLPSADGAGYLAWRPHPNTGLDAPVGFALVGGLLGERRSITGFWVTPVLRREGIGRALALHTLSRHPGPWSIGFQHENISAVRFWRAIADIAFAGGWSEVRRPVPNRPHAPADHIIESA
jgi:ribosomal protein S18 acetylase RimI-like enzyme